MKKGIIILMGFCLLACNDKKEETEIPNAETEAASPILGNMELPEVIGDCSCKVALNLADFQAGKFVYVDDYGSTAYLKIDNEDVSFPLNDGFDLENFNQTFENQQYSIQLHMENKEASDDEEIHRYEGTIVIKNKATQKDTSVPVYGECSCESSKN